MFFRTPIPRSLSIWLEIHNVADVAFEGVAYLDKYGRIHVLSLGEFRKDSRGYADGKAHLSARHTPVDQQFPKPIVAKCHAMPLICMNMAYIISFTCQRCQIYC